MRAQSTGLFPVYAAGLEASDLAVVWVGGSPMGGREGGECPRTFTGGK